MLHFGFSRSLGHLAAALILALTFLIIGGVMIAVGADNYQDGKETESWPATAGRVLSSSVDSETRTTRRDGRTQTTTTYEPIVRYEYTVAGTVYTEDDVTAADFSGSQDRAYRIAGRYPDGAATTVYYDPEHPKDAVLEPGADARNVYLFGGGGAVFGIVGLGALGFAGFFLRRLRRDEP